MQPKPFALTILDIVSLIVLAVAAYLALVFAPTEAVMGQVQRVFYFHVGTAWVGLLGFLFAAVSGIVYLITKDAKWDRVEVAAVEVSVVFFFITIVLGSIWARPVWNTWWTWDARLTFTLILFFLFLGYRALRGAVQDPSERARFSAVLGIMGLILVPFVHLTVYLFRTLHPQPIVLKPSEPSLPWSMLRTLLTSLFFYTVLLLGFLTTRYGLGKRAQFAGGDDGR
ncbi:MAG TPA: cytochrome c biogenesis protein CcsA [Anaerolineales bacterium]